MKENRTEKNNEKAREFGFRMGQRIRLSRWVQKMQQWVDQYPLSTAFSMIALVSLMSVLSIASDIVGRGSSEKETLAAIAQTSETIREMRRLQESKKEAGEMVNAIASTTLDLKERFDSLAALPHKTREDSLELVSIGYKLEYIIKEIKK